MFKQTVSTVSERVFPGLGYSINNKNIHPVHCQFISKENEVTRNFPLQVALFFNITFLPVWLVTIGVMLPLKYHRLPDLYKIILIIALAAATTIELIRLYMGYFGNLTDNIPGLAGFWMLTLLLQAPLHLLLLHPMLLPSVVEMVTQTVICCLLCVQLVAGFVALQRVAKHSSAKFHVAQFLSDNSSEIR